MNQNQWLAEQFEENRGHLRGVAYRMLGSASDAEDAVQESWLRLSRNGADGIANLGGWLTTVVARVCLDMLRSRNSRREDPLESPVGAPPVAHPQAKMDPETEALMADSVGLALLVVLDRLDPAERLAFVLHDLFDLPFEQIGEIVGRSSAAARQLASRARRRVRGAEADPGEVVTRQRRVADRFITALRAGDVPGLVALLDPGFTVVADKTAMQAGLPQEVHGAEAWAKQAVQAAKGARYATTALVDGSVGIVIAPKARLFRVLRLTMVGDAITAMEVIGDRDRLRQLDLAAWSD
ncbi:MAG TPA: sigma-70 family RNA polymerase sigma factor [Acidobacteriaceae bacterium]|jgi:RNA polymerase sigma-70 factor (ECF subfamily)|nr:sigma-70 family RNA polymerase sigma factor [Acidobacteriaceae bacterium]